LTYTPINQFKLKRESREFLARASKFKLFSVKNIHVPKEYYDDILESISLSERELYKDGIPFEGKLLLRID
jgi:hypothetical protein